MGDRHGGCFARRGRALSPPHRGFPTARCGFPMPRRGLPMARGGGQDLPRARTLPSAKASRHGARAKEFAPRRNTPHGEGLPTQRTSKRICPAGERSPRRRPLDTAHEPKDLPRAGTRPSTKVSRHGARAKGFARAGTLPTAKASRHGTRAKGFAPAREGSPRRRHPDTAHERKDLPRAGTRPSANASRHGARAKGFAQRGSHSLRGATNGGPPSTDEQPEKHPFGGVAPERARPLPSSFTEKK